MTRSHGLLALVFLAYFALALGVSSTRQPWCDEGWFASSAWNLVRNGHMGMTVEELHGGFPGIESHTYWQPPLHYLAQALSYEVFGFGIFQLRLVSVAFGALGVAATFALAGVASQKRSVALLAAAFVAFDNIYLIGSGDGRMDMMSAALGLAGIAAYIRFREQRLALATLLGHSLVAASGLTHPNGALWLAGLLYVTLRLDRRRIGRREIAAAALPYLMGGLGWGAYILRDPHAFRLQFGGNVASRVWILSPLEAILVEIRGRYLETFGFSETAAPWTRARILIPVAYATGVLGSFLVSRRGETTRLLAGVTLLMTVLMTFLMGNRSSAYLVHLIPLAAIGLASFLETRPRLLALATSALLVALQLGTTIVQIARDPFHRTFVPAVRAADEAAGPGGLILGSAELAFGLGFEGRLVDDCYLGDGTARDPAAIVMNPRYEWTLSLAPPESARRLRAILERYHETARSGGYVIYARGAAASPR